MLISGAFQKEGRKQGARQNDRPRVSADVIDGKREKREALILLGWSCIVSKHPSKAAAVHRVPLSGSLLCPPFLFFVAGTRQAASITPRPQLRPGGRTIERANCAQ